MKKVLTSIATTIVCIFFAAIIVYAISMLFFAESVPIIVPPKTIFQFDLSTGANPGETGPSDSFTVSPTIYNDATENMYVFIVVDQPACNDESLYTYTVADSWKLVSSTVEKQIYAYAGDEMTVLLVGETTDALTSQITMKDITNAEYAQIDSLNITITGYAIGTEDISTDPAQAWAACKQAGSIE